jgi:CBS domain containing-hemolysin-like protein
MPEGNGPSGDGDRGAEPRGDANRALWRAIRAFFGRSEADQSLRAQLEEAIDEHETEAAGPADGDLTPLERQMVRNLLHFSEHDADDVAVPRGEIVSIAAAASFDQLVASFAEHGHSRVLVHGESLDDVLGMVHIKDVFAIIAGMHMGGRPAPDDWASLMRQPLFVPQARGALDVLADMRASRTHLAVVVDEYSGTDGLITIEDLVEEIVGDIEDEHDDAPEELLVQLGEDLWDADARAELDDVAAKVDPRLAEVEEDIDTIGGLAVVLAGQVPAAGATLDHPSGWRLEVTAANERRVARVRLHAPPRADGEA